jgi:hypothetical protein
VHACYASLDVDKVQVSAISEHFLGHFFGTLTCHMSGNKKPLPTPVRGQSAIQ